MQYTRLVKHFVNLSIILFTYVSCHFTRKKSFSAENYSGRIVGGTPVEITQYPSAVQFYNFGSLCAGTILNSWIVVTAGHCFDHNKDLHHMVVKIEAKYTFDPNAIIYYVLDFVIHEAYNQTIQLSCDIALLLVEGPMKLGEKSSKAIIVNNNKWMKSLETNFTVVGWGWTKYGGPVSQVGLKKTKLRFVSTLECSEMHHLHITPDMFCLYGDGIRDTCKGDSGGGVLWNGMLVGIVSFGDGCAKKNKPSVYSNVWYFRNWIEKNIRRIFNSYCLKNFNYTQSVLR